MLEKNNELDGYDKITVAPHYRDTREKLIKDNDLVDEKYQKYIPILARRLNKIHGVEHDEIFWKKCFSLSLLRYITFYYDLFQRCEDHFDSAIHDCTVVSEDSYYTPKDFEDHRDFFQTTAFGQEQIFSIYIHLFYPDSYKAISKTFIWPTVPSTKKNIFLKIKDKLSRITINKVITRLLSLVYKMRQPVVIITGSYFSAKNMNKVLMLGKGKIQQVTISKFIDKNSVKGSSEREYLAKSEDNFDKFDRLFFQSIKSSFPSDFIENFNSIHNTFSVQLQRYKNVRYVINENWIGNQDYAIFVAIAQQKGVKHIYNEHNFLQHHFLKNNLKYLYPLVDQFITLGWSKIGMPAHVIKGASLYEWKENKNHNKNYDILYIEGPPAVKTPEFSSSYGDSESYNAENSLIFKKTFFSLLSNDIIQRVVYRPYPLNKYSTTFVKPYMDCYDQMEALKDHLHNVNFIDDYRYSSKEMIGKSKIVVVDYLSTSYVESLIGSTPTIFFWIEKNYFLNDLNLNFYQDLIDVGICHTNPERAANFLAIICKNPEGWWNDEKVERARLKFLSDNFGNEKDMIDYYLKCISDNNSS